MRLPGSTEAHGGSVGPETKGRPGSIFVWFYFAVLPVGLQRRSKWVAVVVATLP